MSTLNGQPIKDTYQGLLKTTDNAAIDGTLKALTDGLGNPLPIEVSNTGVNFTGTVTGLPDTGMAINDTVPNTAHTGDLFETIIDTVLVPAGTVKDGDVFNFLARISGSKAASGTTLTKAYVNTSAAIGGQALAGGGAIIGTTSFQQSFNRYFYVNQADGTGLGTQILNAPVSTDLATTPVNYVQSTINWTVDQYIVLTGQLSNAANSVSCAGSSFSIMGGLGPQGPQGTQGPQGAAGTNGTNGTDGIMSSIVAGTNITVDATDPANPIVNGIEDYNPYNSILLSATNTGGYGIPLTISSSPIVGFPSFQNAIDQSTTRIFMAPFYCQPGRTITQFIIPINSATADDQYKFGLYDTYDTGTPKDLVHTFDVNVIGANGGQYVTVANPFTPTQNRYILALLPVNNGNSMLGTLPSQNMFGNTWDIGGWGTSPVGLLGQTQTLVLGNWNGILPTTFPANQNFGGRAEVLITLYRIQL